MEERSFTRTNEIPEITAEQAKRITLNNTHVRTSIYKWIHEAARRGHDHFELNGVNDYCWEVLQPILDELEEKGYEICCPDEKMRYLEIWW